MKEIMLLVALLALTPAVEAQNANQQTFSRATEDSIDQACHYLALNDLAIHGGCIDMRTIALIADQEPFPRHDLHHSQRCRVL